MPISRHDAPPQREPTVENISLLVIDLPSSHLIFYELKHYGVWAAVLMILMSRHALHTTAKLEISRFIITNYF